MVDSHTHIKISNNKVDSLNNIKNYLKMLEQNNISESIVTIDPFIDDIKCKKDSNHFVKMKNNEFGNDIICKCSVCRETIYQGNDPFVKYNEFLIETLKNEDKTHVFPVLAVTPKSLQYMVDYYLEKYKGVIKGLKGYTGLSSYTLDDIAPIKANLPMLVHTGTYDNQNPDKMKNFISKYDNYFILAHFGALNLEALQELKKLDNVLIDISPAKFIYNTYILNKRNGGIFNKDKITKIDDMYYLLADIIGVDRILWGSDFPYSDQKEELDTFLNSKVFTDSEKQKILEENPRKVL